MVVSFVLGFCVGATCFVLFRLHILVYLRWLGCVVGQLCCFVICLNCGLCLLLLVCFRILLLVGVWYCVCFCLVLDWYTFIGCCGVCCTWLWVWFLLLIVYRCCYGLCLFACLAVGLLVACLLVIIVGFVTWFVCLGFLLFVYGFDLYCLYVAWVVVLDAWNVLS